MCRKISEYGLGLLHEGQGILTHCNAGPLATSRYGTAIGPMLLGREQGMNFRVFADETRPLLQGARLTSYELQKAGVDVTLICDNMKCSIPLGIALALAAAFVVKFIFDKTVFGFELRAVGRNPICARYTGIKVGRRIVVSLMLSGMNLKRMENWRWKTSFSCFLFLIFRSKHAKGAVLVVHRCPSYYTFPVSTIVGNCIYFFSDF